MRNCLVSFAAVAALVPLLALSQTRASGPWWPNPEWGADDQAGASNRITPAKVMEAAALVTTGRIYELGHPYTPDMPLRGGRVYSLVSAGKGPARASNGFVSNEEMVASQIGQVGTQFDGLGHIGQEVVMADGRSESVFYNGVTSGEMDGRNGLAKLGIEHVKPIVTRGVLIDIAAHQGVDTLASGYEVSLADVRGALARQDMAEADLREGDAILFRYGWSRLWGDPAAFNESAPGIGLEVARWLVQRKPSMVAADSWPVEVVPARDPDQFRPVHQELITRNGIFILENLKLEELAAEGTHEFMFVMTPIAFTGASGSPARPLAIR
jgi:hypothetical protein